MRSRASLHRLSSGLRHLPAGDREQVPQTASASHLGDNASTYPVRLLCDQNLGLLKNIFDRAEEERNTIIILFVTLPTG